jgi:hypothetical protein
LASHTPDEWIERLARLYRDHPAWKSAARRLVTAATSTVYFSHCPGEPWHLEQREGETRLLPGASPDPDFVFRFSPSSIVRLEAVTGGVGDFAVELFTLITEVEPDEGVGLRVVAGFPRLVRRGYLGLLLASGPRVLAFGAAHGVRTVGALRRLVAQLRDGGPADWETEARG